MTNPTPDLDDEMTPDEKRWFSRLRRVCRDMPDTVEIQVHQGSIQMNRNGARDIEFWRSEHADNVEELASFRTERFYPCSESI